MGQVETNLEYSKTCVKQPLSKRPKNGFQDRLSINADQKVLLNAAILWTCIKLPFVIKISVVSIFEWPFYPGFTVYWSQFRGRIYKLISLFH